MKILKKFRANMLVAWLAAFVLAVSWIAGVSFVSASADDMPPTDITYIETNVEDIEFVKHPTCVFFGFRLTESDYDNFGAFQGDFGGAGGDPAVYAIYEKYIALWLTYWKDFANMNSEGARFDQLYAYWDGSAVGPWFANTVTHRSTLKLLEYGFVISIPAGTTFPSATYVHGNCQGAPIMYKTTKDCAFYYDGNDFKPLDFAIAEGRIAATQEMDSINSKAYYEAERIELASLISATKEEIKLCITLPAIQEKMAAFYASLDKIMSIADYEELEVLKSETKVSLSAFFAALSEDNYVAEDWEKIVNIQQEGMMVIDSVQSFADVEDAVKAVKFAVNNVSTLEKNAKFQAYRTAAAEKVMDAFDETLYREAERAEGEKLVQEGKQAVEKASSYAAVDGISAEYIAKISALKTDAQWQEEENTVVDKGEEEETPPTENNNVVIIPGEADNSSEKSGCGSVISSTGIMFGVMLMAAAVTINKKKVGK
jgi:hypothetical protein